MKLSVHNPYVRLQIPVIFVLIFLICTNVQGQDENEKAKKNSRMIEIRSYTLKPGSRDEFHKLFLERALPMLKRWNVEVVAYGPSLHDSDSYFLMRAYNSLEERQ